MRSGTGAWVADDDPLAPSPFVVAADLDGKRSGSRIRLGAAVDAADVVALLAGVVEDRRLEWEDGELVLRVERRLDALRLGTVPGLPDEAYEHDGQLTKRDLRASALARLMPAPGQLLWDVGAGAGSVGIEWMRADETCRTIAVESDDDLAYWVDAGANFAASLPLK